MSFISSVNGTLINSDRIVRFVPTENDRYIGHFVDEHGDADQATFYFDEVAGTETVIPNTTNLRVLDLYIDDEDGTVTLSRIPILGWRWGHGSLTPVILEQDNLWSIAEGAGGIPIIDENDRVTVVGNYEADLDWHIQRTKERKPQQKRRALVGARVDVPTSRRPPAALGVGTDEE